MENIFKNKNNRDQFLSYNIITEYEHEVKPEPKQLQSEQQEYQNLPQAVHHEYQDLPTSSLLFPSVMSCIKTGSRAENTHHRGSDFDFMYVIGPIKAKERLEDFPSTIDPNQFVYLERTEHDGFYYIKDRYNNYLYPQMLQMKLAPVLNIGNQNIYPHENEHEKGIATAKNQVNRPAITVGEEDQVIAIELEAWPLDIWSSFASNARLIWCEDLLPKLKGTIKTKIA